MKILIGFTGSAGVAVVTLNNASLWTDSRYYLRADKELNKDFWKLMKSGFAFFFSLLIFNYTGF